MEFCEMLEKLESKLRGIVWRVTGNRADQEDLIQEMWLYLWENKEKLKDKTEAYLLKACYFRAKHCLNQGKSIDSKPRKNLTVISLYCNDNRSEVKTLPIFSDFSITKNVLVARNLRDKIREDLSQKLSQTYDLLLEGYSPVEIAKRLNLTYEAVRLRIEKIRKIARSYL